MFTIPHVMITTMFVYSPLQQGHNDAFIPLGRRFIHKSSKNDNLPV